MNAAIRAATLVGRSLGVEMIGIERGYRGLLDDAFSPLEPQDIAGILREGGTMLGSARCKEFHKREVRDQARAILARRGIDGLIVIGGNGSLTGALHLADPARSAAARRSRSSASRRRSTTTSGSPACRSASTPR